MPIYFVLLSIATLIASKFGFLALLLVLIGIFLLVLWSRLKYRTELDHEGYNISVEQGFREQAWVVVKESGKSLALDAEWQLGGRRLQVFVGERLYFAPEFEAPLSPEATSVLLKRISEALTRLNIEHWFVQPNGHSLPD
jgi:hypothetical protein